MRAPTRPAVSAVPPIAADERPALGRWPPGWTRRPRLDPGGWRGSTGIPVFYRPGASVPHRAVEIGVVVTARARTPRRARPTRSGQRAAASTTVARVEPRPRRRGRTLHRDRPRAVGQPPEDTGDDRREALVEPVDLVLGTAVTGVAAAPGEPVDADRGRRLPASPRHRRRRPSGCARGPSSRHRPPAARHRTDRVTVVVGASSHAVASAAEVAASPSLSQQAVVQASTRAPSRRHFPGSSRREYSSSRGDRSGCGSGHCCRPRPVTTNAASTAACSSARVTTAP